MPELPEVETVVRQLRAAGLAGRQVVRAEVHWQRVVAEPSAAEFRRRVCGLRVESLARRGKYVRLDLSGGHILLIHLRMTGRLSVSGDRRPRDRHELIVLRLDDGRWLRYHDTRKFGRWYLVADARPRLGRLGPEPLASGFTARRFGERLAGRRRMLKPLLLDQEFIAGLGNIYVDEALWDAGVHPRRQAAALTPAEQRRLFRSVRKVLRRSIQAMGTTLGKGEANFYGVGGRRGGNQRQLRVFRRVNSPCPRCRTPIVRLVVAQRSTHICPRCQRPEGRRNAGGRRP